MKAQDQGGADWKEREDYQNEKRLTDYSILDWSAELSKRRWRLAGRADATLDTSRWPPRILAEWTPTVVQQQNGILPKRKVGRPRARWEDTHGPTVVPRNVSPKGSQK